MRKGLWYISLSAAGVLAASAPSLAAVEFFGTARVIPTFYSNFDFNDDQSDKPTLNEAGWTSGPHVRSELRLGWSAAGDKWKIKMIAEADVLMEKDTADRSFYAGDANQSDAVNTGATKEDQPNTGGEFGIERAELLYAFSPAVELETGWDIRQLDIKSGGLLFGDDHPFLGFRGKFPTGTIGWDYEALYIPIQNRDKINVSDPWYAGDWTVYLAKVGASLDTGKGVLTAAPFYAFSDNEDKNANVHYYGFELTGQAGPVKPALEIVGSTGKFEDGGPDIQSWAAFAGAEIPVTKAFSPYAAVRYARGDDDKTDDDVQGWVGITDIARFTPLLGMDGNILGEHLASGASVYNSPLYSYSPERAVGGNTYGGISNASSGNNPGQRLLAIGAKGDLSDFVPNLSYKTQAFFIWYDQTDNLVNVQNASEKVDTYAGTTFDLQVQYALSKNFSAGYIFSTFVPGKGIENQVDANDPAFVNSLTLAWAY